MQPHILQLLHDIHEPPPPSIWFFTKGLWLFFLFLLVLSGISSYYFLFWKKQHIRRKALKKLKTISQTPDPATFLIDLNYLLKQVALAHHSRSKVASLYGTPWLAFLDETSHHKTDFIHKGQALASHLYQKQTPIKNIEPLLHMAYTWIRAQSAISTYNA